MSRKNFIICLISFLFCMFNKAIAVDLPNEREVLEKAKSCEYGRDFFRAHSDKEFCNFVKALKSTKPDYSILKRKDFFQYIDVIEEAMLDEKKNLTCDYYEYFLDGFKKRKISLIDVDILTYILYQSNSSYTELLLDKYFVVLKKILIYLLIILQVQIGKNLFVRHMKHLLAIYWKLLTNSPKRDLKER
jgi:hypothetical protein